MAPQPLPVFRSAPAVRGPVARRLRRAGLAAVAVAAVLAPSFVSAAPAAAARVPARTATERHIGWVIESVMNAERAAHHLPAVHMSPQLLVSARNHNLTMARKNTMSHQLRGEPAFTKRISAARYRWNYAGENIAWNSRMSQAGVVALQKLMYNEKAPNNGHRVNILNRHFHDVGIDVYFDRLHHKVWLTTDFGHKL